MKNITKESELNYLLHSKSYQLVFEEQRQQKREIFFEIYTWANLFLLLNQGVMLF